MKELTIVIPMYNSQNTITDTLDSILNQTLLDPIKEIIIINDGSTDNSLSIVENYRKKNNEIPISIFTQINQGVSAARNFGMAKVNTDWIALLDSDDSWLEDKIEFQKNILDNNLNIDFIGGEVEEKPMKILFRKIDYLYKASLKDMLVKPFPATSTVIFKKSILDTVPWFDENQRYSEDMKFFMEICKKFNCYYSPKQVVIFGRGKPRFGASGLSSNLKEMHRGSQTNLTHFYKSNDIGTLFYLTVKIYNQLKYFRRIILTKFYVKKDKLI